MAQKHCGRLHHSSVCPAVGRLPRIAIPCRGSNSPTCKHTFSDATDDLGRSCTGLPLVTGRSRSRSRAWRADDSLPYCPVDAHVRVGHEGGRAPVRDESNGEADHADHGPRLDGSVLLDVRQTERPGEGGRGGGGLTRLDKKQTSRSQSGAGSKPCPTRSLR